MSIIGTVSVNNGLGATASGDVYDVATVPGPVVNARDVTSTKKLIATVASGVGTFNISVTSACNSTVGTGTHYNHSISAVLANPDATTIEVESLLLTACYTVPMAEGERTIKYLAFGPSRNLVWIRSSGHLDAVEWCPACLAYIGGANRDGGLTMPEGYWQSAKVEGRMRRLSRVDVARENFDPLNFLAYTERVPAGVTSSAPSTQRWARFDTSALGRTHMLRVRVPEGLMGVQSIDMVFSATSGPDR